MSSNNLHHSQKYILRRVKINRFSKNKGILENENTEKEPVNLDPKQDMFLGMMQIVTAHKWYVKCTILIDNSFSITNITKNISCMGSGSTSSFSTFFSEMPLFLENLSSKLLISI